MAGSGPNFPPSMGPAIDYGWMNGAGDWFQQIQERKAKFLAAHTDWSIIHVVSLDCYEASTGHADAPEGLTVMRDRHLGRLMDRLEERFKPQAEEEPEAEE